MTPSISDRRRFRHQRYSPTAPTAAYRQLVAPPQPPVGSEEFAHRMGEAGRRLRAAGVGAIVLVHGTFVGDDLFEAASLADPWLPRLADWIRRTNKQVVDRLLADAGNFTIEYAALMEESLAADGGPTIPVRRFLWSGSNCHLARAAAAVRLVDELASLDTPTASSPLSAGLAGRAVSPGRILCFGHSHGGNALALATSLLAADVDERREFLEMVRSSMPRPRTSNPREDAWQRACQRLDSAAGGVELLGGRRLDVVTFGVPIRYGWDPAGCGGLLHFVNHRLVRGCDPYRTRLPSSLDDFLGGRGGDYVHQLGICGSNFAPLPLRWRLWRAERELTRLLAPSLPWHGYFRRLRDGMRVADAGTTLLVDYGVPERRRRLRHILGHGVYTQSRWMAFHAQHVAQVLYGLQ